MTDSKPCSPDVPVTVIQTALTYFDEFFSEPSHARRHWTAIRHRIASTSSQTEEANAEAETYRMMRDIAINDLGYPSILEALEAAPHAEAARSQTKEAAQARKDEREWQPIETAPRDGTQFLALVTNGWYALASAPAVELREGWPYQWWRTSDRQSYPVEDTHPAGYDWTATSTLRLTHWMPLPDASAIREMPRD